jgi:hypothetical protein
MPVSIVVRCGRRHLLLLDRRIRVLQNDGAGLQQGLQVANDLRPPAGNRNDEIRGFALDGVSDRKLDRRATLLQFHSA